MATTIGATDAGTDPRGIADATEKILAFLKANKDGDEFPLNSWLLEQIGYPPGHPLHKETDKLEKEVVDHQQNIKFKRERREGGSVLLVWFAKTPRKVKKKKGTGTVGMTGNAPNQASTTDANDNVNGDGMGERSSDGFVERALAALEKLGRRASMKDLAKALGRKRIAGPELGLLRDAATSHPNVNTYKARSEEGGRSHTELEWVRKATTKEWVKTEYGKGKTQRPSPAPRHEASSAGEGASRPSFTPLRLKPKREEAKDLDLLLTTIKENVQAANGLRDNMAKEMLQKEQQAEDAMKRRAELIENARELKVEASQARKDARSLGKQLRQAEKKMAATLSQMTVARLKKR